LLEGRLIKTCNFATPELRDITTQWHGLSDMKPSGKVLSDVRGIRIDLPSERYNCI
jgi:hypothetical protein